MMQAAAGIRLTEVQDWLAQPAIAKPVSSARASQNRERRIFSAIESSPRQMGTVRRGIHQGLLPTEGQSRAFVWKDSPVNWGRRPRHFDVELGCSWRDFFQAGLRERMQQAFHP
jgi:hypothetical protein